MEQENNNNEMVAVDPRSPAARAYREIIQYLNQNKRTLAEEYELVQQRKSPLSKRLRDFVTLMYEIEQETKTTLPLDSNTKPPIVD